MTPDQEMIEGLKLAGVAGSFIGLAALAMVVASLIGG